MIGDRDDLPRRHGAYYSLYTQFTEAPAEPG